MTTTSATLMQQVEERLEIACNRGTARMQEVCWSLLGAGGKRTRPRLLIEAGLTAELPCEALVPLATAVELAHNATLLQDDVIDKSPLRRGQPTAWSRWGAGSGILGGNLLFMRAFETLAEANLPLQSGTLAAAIGRLVEGELLQADQRWNPHPSLASVRTVAERKTGEFFGWITRSIAELGNGDAEAAQRWGMLLGFGFQLADDLLDFEQPATKIGKPAENDLREGYVAYPVAARLAEEPNLAAAIRIAFEQRSDAAFALAYQRVRSGETAVCTREELAQVTQKLASPDWLPACNSILAEQVQNSLYRNA